MDFQKMVNEYASNTAQIKALKERQEELRVKLIPFLRKYECPDKGPFLIKLIQFGRSEFSWKDFSIKVARKLWPETYKHEIEKAKTKAGEKEISELTVEVNPKWE